MKALRLTLTFIATAIAFAVFGLAGLCFWIFDWFLDRRYEGRARTLAARRIVEHWFQLFVCFISALNLVRIDVHNAQRLKEPGRLFVANHPTLIDVVVLLSLIPGAGTMVKAKLLSNPFTRPPIQSARYLPNDIGHDAFDEIQQEFEAGGSFLIFPEGTRTPMDLPAGEYPKIHRGIGALAVMLDRPITPIRITAKPRWLTKEQGWWHLPESPMVLTIEVLDDIDIRPYQPIYAERPSRATRAIAKILLERLFG